MKASIIIPYKHNSERYDLFRACINSIPDNNKYEICIHETGKTPKLKLNNNNRYKYLFTHDETIFDRAWSINVGVRHLSTCNHLVLADGDIIFSKEWFDELDEKVESPVGRKIYNGFGQLIDLSIQGTRKYLNNPTFKFKDVDIKRVRRPKVMGAAGGVTFLSTDVIFDMHGIPEDFRGSWGGEDNAFMMKLIAYGYDIKQFKSTIYHLYHDSKTIRKNRRNRILIQNMKKMKLNKWELHTHKSINWGSIEINRNVDNADYTERD